MVFCWKWYGNGEVVALPVKLMKKIKIGMGEFILAYGFDGLLEGVVSVGDCEDVDEDESCSDSSGDILKGRRRCSARGS